MKRGNAWASFVGYGLLLPADPGTGLLSEGKARRRGFSCQIAHHICRSVRPLEGCKVEGGGGGRRGNPAALQGMSESRNKIGRSSEGMKRCLWCCGGECGWAREEIIDTPARRSGRHISQPNSAGRPRSFYQRPPPLRWLSRASRGLSGAVGADVVALSLDPLPVRGSARSQYPLVQGRSGSRRVSASQQAEKQPKLFLAPPQAEIGALHSPPHPLGKMGTGRGLWSSFMGGRIQLPHPPRSQNGLGDPN